MLCFLHVVLLRLCSAARRYGHSRWPARHAAGFLVGGSSKLALGAPGGAEVRDYNVLLGYKAKDYTLGASTEKKFTTATAFYYHTLSPSVNAGAIAKVRRLSTSCSLAYCTWGCLCTLPQDDHSHKPTVTSLSDRAVPAGT